MEKLEKAVNAVQGPGLAENPVGGGKRPENGSQAPSCPSATPQNGYQAVIFPRPDDLAWVHTIENTRDACVEWGGKGLKTLHQTDKAQGRPPIRRRVVIKRTMVAVVATIELASGPVPEVKVYPVKLDAMTESGLPPLIQNEGQKLCRICAKVMDRVVDGRMLCEYGHVRG